MQGQRSPKANNKSLGFVNELKTKAISRYVKKTIPPSLKRLLLNSQACRKPSVKPYNQHEPCKACEQGGLLAPHWPHPRGYHSLEKGFPHPTYILQSTQLRQLLQKSRLPLLEHQPGAQPCRWIQQRKSY